MTLLAIDLPQPEGATAMQMLDSVSEHRSEYIAFLISFWLIAQHWRTHHFLFHLIDRSSGRLITLNMAWLLLIVLTPFTTKLLSERETNVLRFGTYAVTQAVQSTLFVLMTREILGKKLLADPADALKTRPAVLRSLIFTATFLVSVPVYIVGQYAGFLVWFALPGAFDVTRRITRHRAGKPRRTAED